MKKLNIPLIIGLIIVMAIASLVFFGEYYAPHDARVGEDSLWVEKEDGARALKRAPFSPDENHIFGTDNGGRDVLSVIMAGAKNTFTIVLLVTLFRFLIAIPIAFFSAFGEGISKSLIEIFSTTFTAVPSLLLCVMVLKVHSISSLSLVPSIAAFSIVFTVIGWGRLAKTIEEKIKDILKQDFIQGEIALGKSKFAIATKNVAVHLMPTIIVFIFLEISFVLLLLAQLGVFEIFVGNKQIFMVRSRSGDVSSTTYNFFPEWGAMLASTRQSMRSNRFWLSIYPLSAFVISIIGFNLLGQGLNYELNKRNSKFISYVNKLWFHLSIKTFIGEVKSFRKKRRIVLGKLVAITTVLLVFLIPLLNNVVIADDSILVHVNELSKDEYEGRLIGTTGNEKAAEYIVGQLRNYKVKPLFGDGYFNEFEIDPSYNIIGKSEMMVTNSLGEQVHELKYKTDYYFETWSSNNENYLEGEILTVDDYFDNKFDQSKEYFLLLDYEGNQSSVYERIISERKDLSFIKAIIMPDAKEAVFLSKKIELNRKGLTKILDQMEAFSDGLPPIKINVSRNTAMKLWKLPPGNTVAVNAMIENIAGLKGRNIGGIIQGKNNKNPIIITTTYDYLGVQDFGINNKVEDKVVYKGIYENVTSIAGSLELARNFGETSVTPDRSIIFLFIDGSQVTNDGVRTLEKYDLIQQEPLLIYLNYMGIAKWGREEDSLYHYTIVEGSNSKVESEFYRWMRRNSAKSNYYIVPDSAIKVDHFKVLKDEKMDITVTVLQGLKETQKFTHKGMPQPNLGEIDGTRLRSHIQYLLDSIRDIAYGKRLF